MSNPFTTERTLPTNIIVHTLFGNILGIIGCALVSFFMIFVWVFTMNSEFIYILKDSDITQTQGVILSVFPTNSSENRTRIYQNDFQFVIDGNTYSNHSYTKGQRFNNGDKVTINYSPKNPTVSFIDGARREVFSKFIGIFVPLIQLPIALILIAISLIMGFKKLHLLKIGIPATATFIKMEQTITRVNRRYVMKMFFEFKAKDGSTHQTTTKTHQPEKLLDNPQEILLYDPNNPTQTVFLDNLSGKPQINKSGNITSPVPFTNSAGFILALLATFTLSLTGSYLFYLLTK